MKRKYITLLSLCIVTLTMVLAFTSCQSKWKPEIQGSQVLEIPYEDMEDAFLAEKYADFSSFSKSQWANYHFISQAQAKDERYSKEYFKSSDLIVIKFNRAEKGIDFTVIDMTIENNVCTVDLLPVKRVAKLEEQQTTYCCFVETETDVSSLDIKLNFQEDVVHESQSFSYITDNNEFYTFEGQTEPLLFVIDSVDGINQFFAYDEALSNQSYIYTHLVRYSQEAFANYSLMLVRVPSSDFEQLAVYYDNDVLHIVGTYSNHYLYEKETKHHKLVALLIPKDLKIDKVSRTVYYEYEDNLAHKAVYDDFVFEEQSELASGLIAYSFTSKND